LPYLCLNPGIITGTVYDPHAQCTVSESKLLNLSTFPFFVFLFPLCWPYSTSLSCADEPAEMSLAASPASTASAESAPVVPKLTERSGALRLADRNIAQRPTSSPDYINKLALEHCHGSRAVI
jgi:hypothetical protein